MTTYILNKENAQEIIDSMNEFFKEPTMVASDYGPKISLGYVDLHHLQNDVNYIYHYQNSPILAISEKYQNHVRPLDEGDEIHIEDHTMNCIIKKPFHDTLITYEYFHISYDDDLLILEISNRIKQSFMDEIYAEDHIFDGWDLEHYHYSNDNMITAKILLSTITAWIYDRIGDIINAILKTENSSGVYSMGLFYHPDFPKSFDIIISIDYNNFIEEGIRNYTFFSSDNQIEKSDDINFFAAKAVRKIFPELFIDDTDNDKDDGYYNESNGYYDGCPDYYGGYEDDEGDYDTLIAEDRIFE